MSNREDPYSSEYQEPNWRLERYWASEKRRKEEGTSYEDWHGLPRPLKNQQDADNLIQQVKLTNEEIEKNVADGKRKEDSQEAEGTG